MSRAGAASAAPALPRWVRLTVLASLVSLTLAACGGTAASTDSSTGSSTGSTTVSDTSATESSLPAGAAIDVQGHRGARGLRPENTLPGFELALDLGVDTLELDLHLSADGVVVVSHDPVVDGSKCGLAGSEDLPDPDDAFVEAETLMIAALTAADLAKYQCNRNPSTEQFPDQTTDATAIAGADYHLATLDEVFSMVETYATSSSKTQLQRERANAVRFNIETKRDPDKPENIGDGFNGVDAGAFELAVLDVVAAHGLEDRVTIQSFDPRSLWSIRAVNPNIGLAVLTARGAVDLTGIAEMGASVWSPNQNLVSESSLAEAHDAGLLVIPWTVNELDDMERLIRLGVDGIITDRPDLLLSLVAR